MSWLFHERADAECDLAPLGMAGDISTCYLKASLHMYLLGAKVPVRLASFEDSGGLRMRLHTHLLSALASLLAVMFAHRYVCDVLFYLQEVRKGRLLSLRFTHSICLAFFQSLRTSTEPAGAM